MCPGIVMNIFAHSRGSRHDMHPTGVVLGSTVRPKGFDEVLLEHKLEEKGVGVFMPLPLSQAAVLSLALQGQSSLTCEMQNGKLVCNAR